MPGIGTILAEGIANAWRELQYLEYVRRMPWLVCPRSNARQRVVVSNVPDIDLQGLQLRSH